MESTSGVAADRDRINGGPGNDEIGGSNGPNAIQPGSGEDTVDGAGGDDQIRTRDGSVDSARCGGGRRDFVRADAFDFVPLSCERLSRRGSARAVPLSISVGNSTDAGPGVIFGCSRDGPRLCRATVAIYRGSRLQGRRRARARGGRSGFALFSGRLRRLADKRVRIQVTARDRRGRVRSTTRTLLVQTVS